MHDANIAFAAGYFALHRLQPFFVREHRRFARIGRHSDDQVPGDTLIFVLTYENTGSEPAENFVVTNPMPEAVVFVEAIDSGAIYSVDGGTTFGALETLRVASDSGVERDAQAVDVTHIRWTLSAPIAAGASGQLRFRGVVR